MNPNRQRKIGVLLGYANIIVKNIVNLIYTPMLLAFVGKAEYGVYQTSSSFVFSLSLLSFGFSLAYVRFYMQKIASGEDVDGLNGVYLVLYGAVSLIALFAGITFSFLSDCIFSDSFSPEQVALSRYVMAVLSTSISITLFNSVFDAFVLAHECFGFQQSRQMLTTLATPLFAFLFLKLGMGVVGVAFAQLIISLILLVLNARYCIGVLEMRFKVKNFDFSLFKAIASFSSWIFLNQICDLINQNAPNVLLGAMVGASAVAVFSVAVQIRNVFMSLSATISNVFTPIINSIVAETDDNAELSRLMTRAGRYQMLLFCWIYGAFLFLGRYFISKWAGDGFSDSFWLAIAMTLPLVVPLTQNTGIEIQRAKNMHKARSIALLIMAVMNVIFTIAMTPKIGYWAPAIGYISSIVLGNGLFMNWYYQYRVGLDMIMFWRRNLPILITGGVSAVSFVALTQFYVVGSVGSFVLSGISYSIIYFVIIWYFVLDEYEKAEVAKVLRRAER